jgi:hypothetical protein
MDAVLESNVNDLAGIHQAHVDHYERAVAHTRAVTKACGGREWNPLEWDDSPRGHGVSLRQVLADERAALERAAAGGSVLYRIRLDDGHAFRCGCGCEAFLERAPGKFRCTKCALE